MQVNNIVNKTKFFIQSVLGHLFTVSLGNPQKKPLQNWNGLDEGNDCADDSHYTMIVLVAVLNLGDAVTEEDGQH